MVAYIDLFEMESDVVKSEKMNGDFLVSVIVPVYNTKDCLRECFLSLKAQTYENIEMIFVNDGSTDGGEELLKKFEKEDRRVRVINKRNGGLSSARNAGLKVAQGEFVTFLDSDDYLAKGAIEYLVGLALRHDVGIVACSHYEDYGRTKRDFNRGGFPTKVFSIEEGLREMLDERGFNLQATSKLYKRELFKNVRRGSSMRMWGRLISCFWRIIRRIRRRRWCSGRNHNIIIG